MISYIFADHILMMFNKHLVINVIKKIQLHFVSTLIFTCFITSCVEYKVINIQTIKPAEISLPKDFSQPMVVASIYKGIEGVEESMAQAALDSIAGTEAVLVLTESLSDSPWFQGLTIPTHVHYRDDTSPYILPFAWAAVEEITKDHNADLLISLDYIKVEPKVNQYDYWEGYLQLYYGSLTERVYAYWRIYDLNNKKILGEYLYRDTLIWDKSDYRRVKVGDQLPGFFSAVSYCGYLTGSEYAKKIAPSWMNEQRLYYIKGSNEMQVAAQYADSSQWIDAANQWQKVIKNPKTKPKLAAQAAFNMAFANEMLGSFDVAVEWLNESKKFYSLEHESWYRRILELRIKIMEKL